MNVKDIIKAEEEEELQRKAEKSWRYRPCDLRTVDG